MICELYIDRMNWKTLTTNDLLNACNTFFCCQATLSLTFTVQMCYVQTYKHAYIETYTFTLEGC